MEAVLRLNNQQCGLLLATLTRSWSNRERRGAAPCCHRRTTSESFWSRSDSGPHSWA